MNSSDFTPSFEENFSAIVKDLSEENASEAVETMYWFYLDNCDSVFYQLDRRDAMIWLVRHVYKAFKDDTEVIEHCEMFFDLVKSSGARWTCPYNRNYQTLVSKTIEHILGSEQDFSFSELYSEKYPKLYLDRFLEC